MGFDDVTGINTTSSWFSNYIAQSTFGMDFLMRLAFESAERTVAYWLSSFSESAG